MFKKTLLAAALAAPLSAFAFMTTLDTTLVGGPDLVTFNQMQISGGGSTITVIDSDNSGTLNFGDAFVENGLIAAFGFTDATGSPITGLGLNDSYQLWAVFEPLQGYVSGAASGTGFDFLKGAYTWNAYGASFTSAAITLYYDDNVADNGFNATTVIGTASSPAGGSSCSVEQRFYASGTEEQGACLLRFKFDEAGATIPGMWTNGGIDIADLGNAWLRVDMNIDDFSPTFFQPTYSGDVDDIYGHQIQNISINHNGSASFVPEPGSLALMGLGMLGLFGASRRRKAD